MMEIPTQSAFCNNITNFVEPFNQATMAFVSSTYCLKSQAIATRKCDRVLVFWKEAIAFAVLKGDLSLGFLGESVYST
jgi:hypothetical protein